jgi:hypothetical protein
VLQSPDCDDGYHAIVPSGSRWQNVCTPRVFLRVARYRPFLRGPDLPCPWLVCVADRDDLTPPQIARDLGERAGADVRGYDLGHFDIYVGAGFEQVVADQVAFLGRQLAEKGVRAAA